MRDTLPGFFNLSWKELDSIENNQILLVGVPIEGDKETKKGAKKIPQQIRKYAKTFSGISASFSIHESASNCYDLGNIYLPKNRDKTQRLWKVVSKNNLKLLTIGGDHLITYYMLKYAPFDQKTAIISFDAHADFAEEYPINVKKSHATIFNNLVQEGIISYSQVMLIGGNAYTQSSEEKETIKKISWLSPFEIFKDREQAITKIKEFTAKYDRIYVTLDLDCLDLLQVPSLGTAEPFGLDTLTLSWLLSYVLPKANYVDIVEGRTTKKEKYILHLIIGLIYRIIELWNV